MGLLAELLENGHYAFLTTLLSLGYSRYNFTFSELVIDKGFIYPGKISFTPRINKYSTEQKARRLRIGFTVLSTYNKKANRHLYTLKDYGKDRIISFINSELKGLEGGLADLNESLKQAFVTGAENVSEDTLKEISKFIPFKRPVSFRKSYMYLVLLMNRVGDALSSLWEDERYVRDVLGSSED